MIYTNDYESPLGNILLAGDEQGLTGLWFTEGGRYTGLGLKKEASRCEMDYFDQTKEWLDIYFSGRDPGFFPRSKDAEALNDAEILRWSDARSNGADQHHPERHGSPYGDSSGPSVHVICHPFIFRLSMIISWQLSPSDKSEYLMNLTCFLRLL